jgi:AcrR family transcriptional regulator
MMNRAEVRVPKQRRALRTRAAILDAARAEFSLRGHAAATSKTIAVRAGVSVGSLYQYFSDKDQILVEIAQVRAEEISAQTLGALGNRVAPPASERQLRQRLTDVLEVVLREHRDDPGLHGVLTERRHADEQLDAITTRFERSLIEAAAALLESWGHSGDSLAAAFVLFSMIEGAVHAHVLGGAVVSDERLKTALLDALVQVLNLTLKRN